MIIQHFQTPSPSQLLATAARLGADPAGSTFQALTAVGFNAWIQAADKEHQLTQYYVDNYAPGSEDAILRHQRARRYFLPVTH